MNVHEQFAEDLALYALGSLEGEERHSLENHLETCSACRQELEALRGDLSLFALSTSGPQPPQLAKQRLMYAIEAESRSRAGTVPEQRRFSWWAPLGWAAAATMALAVFYFSREGDRLATQVARLQRESASQQAELERAKEVVATLTAPDAVIVPVTAPNTPPQPQGKAIYRRDTARLIFVASNMPALPAQKTYELWLIPTEGAPIPAGVFKPDAHGSGVVVHPSLPAGVVAKAFAITVETEGGSSNPTMPIVMMGAGS
jgi:anti-sigma-K factor RskA